jgi:hypothetical protein
MKLFKLFLILKGPTFKIIQIEMLLFIMLISLGIIYPVILNAGNSFYNSTNNDNNVFWIDYPVNNNITVTLNTFAGAAMGNMPHYVLMLNLIGVDDAELAVRNDSNILMTRNI